MPLRELLRSVSAAAAVLLLLISSTASAATESLADSASWLARGTYPEVAAFMRANRGAEAESTARVLLASLEGRTGVDSLEMARGVESLLDALTSRSKSGTAEVERLSARAIRLHEVYGGPRDVRMTTALVFRARWFRAHNQLDSTAACYQAALRRVEETLGPNDMVASWVLNLLAAAYRMKGEMKPQRECLERALAIREEKLPANDKQIGLVLGNLALLDLEEGEYPAARERMARSLRMMEEQEGPEGLQVGLALINLSMLSSELGDHATALEQIERCIRVLTKRLGPESWEVVQARVNRAAQLRGAGADGEAEQELRAIVEMFPRIRQSNNGLHPELLGNLAEVLAARGKFAEADSLVAVALEEKRAVYSEAHFEVARTLRQQGEMKLARGDFDSAKRCYRSALEIDTRLFGGHHPDLGRDHLGLAIAGLASNDSAAAILRDAIASENISREHVRRMVSHMPERIGLQLADVRASGLDVMLTLVAQHPSDSALVRLAWDSVVRSRAMLLDELAKRHRVIASRSDSLGLALERELGERRKRLSMHFVRGVTDSASAHRARELQAECEQAEAALAAHSARFRDEQSVLRAGLDDVLSALPGGAALVAFARFNRVVAGRDSAVATDLAFVGLPRGHVGVTVIGDAARTDSLVAAWRRGIEAAARLGRPAASLSASLRRSGGRLRAAIWDSVAARVPEGARLFIVPDGALSLVAFDALPLGGSRYLLEDGHVRQVVSSERRLVQAADARARANALVVGGVDFDQSVARSSRPTASAFRSARASCGSFRDLHFERLPGSLREAKEISELLRRSGLGSETSAARKPLVLSSSLASETAFKQEASRFGIIHLATHGFFLSEGCSGRATATRDRELRAGWESPLLYSGVALAGANGRAKAAPNDEDGVLTAEEVASLDLSAAELVVLSACESGLGTVVDGEGVFGLRRAFEVAGAHRLVLSLWRVRDDDAQFWMRAFYEARSRVPGDVAAAARAASLQLLRERRAAGFASDPSSWGAFIASGERN